MKQYTVTRKVAKQGEQAILLVRLGTPASVTFEVIGLKGGVLVHEI